MKNYKVKITRNFTDKVEGIFREMGKATDTFMCDKERYEFLLSKGAVKLIEKVEEETETEIEEVETSFEEVMKEIVEKPKRPRKKKIDNK